MARINSLPHLLKSPQLSYLVDAHNAFTARIAQDVGFDGIWAGSLGISTSLGCCDCNELSWTEESEMLGYMTSAVEIPILFDAGPAPVTPSVIRRLVRKLESVGVAGVAFEDKKFPKYNSLVDTRTCQLVPVETFCKAIEAAKAAARTPSFVVVARTEGLIYGESVDHALERASWYAEAGADAIIPHCRNSVADPVLRFASRWRSRKPVITIPTTFANTPHEMYSEAGISLVVWANVSIRVCLQALRTVLPRLVKSRLIQTIADGIVPVDDVLQMFNGASLEQFTNDTQRK